MEAHIDPTPNIFDMFSGVPVVRGSGRFRGAVRDSQFLYVVSTYHMKPALIAIIKRRRIGG
jgi:hypothetical protein